MSLPIHTLDHLRHLPILPREFYARPTTEVARDLLGRVLAHQSEKGLVAGIIVETEAYGPDDPANHAHRGRTRRNATMFGRPGLAYIYKIYGMYWCVNAVTVSEGVGEAVLIRALEPVAGIEIMERNRNTSVRHLLCSGPGRLCAALGLTGAMDGADLTAGPLFIAGERPEDLPIITTTRVGITQAADRPWRYYIAGSRYVSKKAPSNAL